jgi:hypothetical protein
MGKVREMDYNEKVIYDIISKSGNWRFFQVIDNNGNSKPQIKIYDPPSMLSYPDFEKVDGDKIVLLVEVKGYYGFFDGRENTVAMLYRQFAQYFVVQRKEQAEVRVVFVIKKYGKNLFYWESLDNIDSMEYYFDFHKSERKDKPEKFIFWNTEDFRTDIENLGI